MVAPRNSIPTTHVRNHTTNNTVHVRDHRCTTRPSTTVPAQRGAPAAQPAPSRTAVLNREMDKILADPSLCLEDKIAALLMAILNFMDDDIEEQMLNVKNLQTKQNTADPEAQGEQRNSIDTATFKLQRLTRKREQLFRTMTAIIERYVGTTQGVLQTLGQR